MVIPQDISLYFHIPFCTKKCPYCHFYVIPNRPLYHALLTEGFRLEWELSKPLLQNKRIVSIYFGGGTPTLLEPASFDQILSEIRQTGLLASDCEITIEANPEEITQALLTDYRQLGINRLSLGIQSLDDQLLSCLGREHSSSKAIDTLFAAKAAGFDNVSIDLMYDIPQQTIASWERTLERLKELPFHHLSLYNLTIEPHTVFFKQRPAQPDPDTSLHCLTSAISAMEEMGLNRYEISAFARPFAQSRHNTGYWSGRPFLGYGPSAFSDWEGERFRNMANLLRYHRTLSQGVSPVDFKERLDPSARLKERFAIHLRLLDGVDLSKFPLLPEETKTSIERLVTLGFLEKNNKRVALTEKGTLFYDTVATDLI